jgi:hypothetical protein
VSIIILEVARGLAPSLLQKKNKKILEAAKEMDHFLPWRCKNGMAYEEDLEKIFFKIQHRVPGAMCGYTCLACYKVAQH